MDLCERVQSELTGLLPGDDRAERTAPLLAHIQVCEACASELQKLRATWAGLPDPALVEKRPPAFLREAVRAHARSALADRRPLGSELWSHARPFAGPVLQGFAASTLIVGTLAARGLLASQQTWITVALSLALGGLLAVLAAALRGTSVRAVRSVFLASVAAFAGYVILAVAFPIPDTVEFCRVRLLAAPELSLGSICLIYLTLAVFYAGLPAGLAAYVWGDESWRWTGGLAEATLFVLLAVPVLGLHFGTAELALGLSALAGLAIGALAGGMVGPWMRRRHSAGVLG